MWGQIGVFPDGQAGPCMGRAWVSAWDGAWCVAWRGAWVVWREF